MLTGMRSPQAFPIDLWLTHAYKKPYFPYRVSSARVVKWEGVTSSDYRAIQNDPQSGGSSTPCPGEIDCTGT